MKTTVLLILFNIYSYTIIAQPFGDAANGFRLEQIHYHNSSGEAGTTTFKYNQQAQLVKAYWTLNNGKRCSVNHYQYDCNGLLTSAYREFSDSITSTELFFYDAAGNKVAENYFRSDSTRGSARYFYENGLLKRAVFTNHKGWLNGTARYFYTTQYQKDSAIFEHNGKNICNISYTYNKDANMTKETWYFANDWSQTFEYTYQKTCTTPVFYTSPFLVNMQNCRISKEDYTFNDEMGGPSYYTYNNDQQLMQKQFIRSDGLTTNTTYTYRTDGRLYSSQRIYSDSTIGRFYYTYNQNKQLIRRTFYLSDSLVAYENYSYNPAQELTTARYYNFDNWISGTITFFYDNFGRLAGGYFKGTDGFDANIEFSYNSENCITAIRWNFSFGKFQKYTFDY